MDSIEERAFIFCNSDQGLMAGRHETFKAGYTACDEDVVKLIDQCDAIDGQSQEWYKGYFAFKNDFLTKLKKQTDGAK